MSSPEQLGSSVADVSRMADAKEFQVPQVTRGPKAFLCTPQPPQPPRCRPGPPPLCSPCRRGK